MALSPGTRLGPYQIEAAIGAGGMGEVYRAIDTRLGRSVAVKVIAADLTRESAFLDRFGREASVLSTLNHPNICTLHDIGDANGARFVVMEYLQGRTLAQWIDTDRKGLTAPAVTERVIAMALSIADALNHAHSRGIVHRDLKPANVMITPAGVKVVDFGLAKALRPRGEEAPTEAPITQQGTFLGTLPYMAPELIDGVDADTRSDVWAFGCVVYEMLTGRRAFEGTTTQMIAAIGAAEVPALPAVDVTRTAPLRHFISRCIARDPEDRWQSGRDLSLELRWIRELAAETAVPVSKKHRPRPWFVAAALVIAAVLAGVMWSRTGASDTALTLRRFTIPVPESTAYTVGGLPNAFAISPDGSIVAHLVWRDGRSRELRLRRIDSFDSIAVRDSENAIAPFFSPDGAWVGFLSGTQIKKASVTGGPAVTVCATAETPSQPSWSPDDHILFADSNGISSVSAAGGRPDLLIPIDRQRGELAFNAPSRLPDGRILFAVRASSAGWNGATVVAHDPGTGARSTLVEGGYAPRLLFDTHLMFSRGSSVFAMRVDAATMTPRGTPVPVLDRPINNATFGWSLVSVSNTGTLLYSEAASRQPTRLVWVDRNGRVESAVAQMKPFEHPRISPDGLRFVVGVRDQTNDVWIGDRQSRALERFTFEPVEEESPVWHPSGRSIAYAMNDDRERLTVMKPIDGGQSEVIGKHGAWHNHLGAWAPDGTVLTMSITESTGTPWNLFLFEPGGRGTPEAKDIRRFVVQASAISPDGRWIVYASDESGRSEVYVDAMPGLGRKRQVSQGGGAEPAWSRDGKEIFFRAGERMMTAMVSPAAMLQMSTPQVLFEGTFEQIDWGERNFDVGPDGRFLMVRSETGRPAAEIRVVVDWVAELKKRTDP